MRNPWLSYRYKNLSLLALSLALFALLAQSQSLHRLLTQPGNWGWLGAFVGGLLFVSTFTLPLGTLILVSLSDSLPILPLSLTAGLGALLGDSLIFRAIRSQGLVDEVKHFFEFFGGEKISHLIHSKFFAWTLPVLGALIIASPLPDELGVGLLGISRLKRQQFLALSYFLNTLGILVLLEIFSFF